MIAISCVEPYQMLVKSNESFLVIDGKIDDTDSEKYISIKKTDPGITRAIEFIPVDSATVYIVENGETNINAHYSGYGIYTFPIWFKTKINNQYQLKVNLKNGKKYESSIETMRETPDILGHTVKFDPEAIKKGENTSPGHFIYIDLKDNPEKGDFYMWNYRIFERQPICISCYEGIYLAYPQPYDKCESSPGLERSMVTYDYSCLGDCWEIIHSEELNIMSDLYSNNLEIKNRLIAKVPYYSNSGFLIEISQQNINAEAFRYLKIIIEQNQTNGTLADSPPAPLVGNVKNIDNKSEIVGGYFMVAKTIKKSFWINRSYDDNAYPIGLLGGRAINYEPLTPSRPPSAPCIKSRTRTPLAPEGWPI